MSAGWSPRQPDVFLPRIVVDDATDRQVIAGTIQLAIRVLNETLPRDAEGGSEIADFRERLDALLAELNQHDSI